jgi:putative heme-binding domain-containing protein
LLGLLDDREPEAVRAAALSALGRQEAPEVARSIVSHYPRMSPALKDRARDVLVSRPRWSEALVAAVEGRAIPAGDLGLDQVRRLVMHQDRTLTGRAEKLWGRVRPANSREKEGRILSVSQILAGGTGHPAAGKPLVAKTCLNCHRLFGEGAEIGPDLSAADRKNLDVLLRNVIDPNAVIREGYQPFVVATTDGRILPGLLVEDTAEKVTVLDAKGVRTSLRRSEVESTARADASLMPEGLLDPFSDQELRDLFAYLGSEPGRP